MPLPTEIFLSGFRGTRSKRFHLEENCEVLGGMQNVTSAQMALKDVHKRTTCVKCCESLRKVAAAHKELVDRELGWGFGEDTLVILEVLRSSVPLPPLINTYLEEYVGHTGLPDVAMNSSFFRVPAWLAQWTKVYAADAVTRYEKALFQTHLVHIPNLSEQHVAYLAIMTQADLYVGSRRRSFEKVLADAKPYLHLGTDFCVMAAQLWVESLQNDGPLNDFPAAIKAVRLLTA